MAYTSGKYPYLGSCIYCRPIDHQLRIDLLMLEIKVTVIADEVTKEKYSLLSISIYFIDKAYC